MPNGNGPPCYPHARQAAVITMALQPGPVGKGRAEETMRRVTVRSADWRRPKPPTASRVVNPCAAASMRIASIASLPPRR